MSSPESRVIASVESTLGSLETARNALIPLTDNEKFSSLSELEDMVSPLGSANLDVALAYTIASLYFVLLRTKVFFGGIVPLICSNSLIRPGKGIAQQSHQIKSELDRIKGYVQRLKSVTLKTKDKSTDGTDAQSTNIPAVRPAHDASAAKRMIVHQLSSKCESNDITVMPKKKRKKGS